MENPGFFLNDALNEGKSETVAKTDKSGKEEKRPSKNEGKMLTRPSFILEFVVLVKSGSLSVFTYHSHP